MRVPEIRFLIDSESLIRTRTDTGSAPLERTALSAARQYIQEQDSHPGLRSLGVYVRLGTYQVENKYMPAAEIVPMNRRADEPMHPDFPHPWPVEGGEAVQLEQLPGDVVALRYQSAAGEDALLILHGYTTDNYVLRE